MHALFPARFPVLLCVVLFLSSTQAGAQFNLGTAKNFAVLAGSTVTNTGPTTVHGDVGVSPGTAVTGFPPGLVVAGAIHSNDAVAGQAQTDLTTAYNAMAGTPCNTDLTGQNLGGLTLTPGVYCFNSSAGLTGTLTLDVQNNPNAVFLFRMGSTLTTASGSAVMAINGSLCGKLFWQTGTSATLGTATTFAGDILSLASITLTTNANSSGRALARNGAVTLDSNVVNTCALIAAPVIDTIASPGVTLGAGSLTDSATVSGRTNPGAGATIMFRLYGPNDATCAGAPVFIPGPVPYPVAGGPVTSPPFTPTLVGTYRWIASYSGDGNNPPVAGVCNAPNETVVVSPPGPTIETIASPGIALGSGTLSDSAIVSGRVNPQAGATITFRLYGPNDATCTGVPVFSPPPVAYPVAGGSVSSAAFVPTQTGIYRWIATYSGDANNPAVAGVCNAPNEAAVVSLNVPTIATIASPGIVLGAGTLSDSAIVSGRVNPQPGATITFRLFGPNNATCAGVPVFSAPPVAYPVAGGSVTSAAFTPTQAGTYRWIASYSGDANNAPAVGLCNAAGESAEVLPAPVAVRGPATPIPVLGPEGLLLLLLTLGVAGAVAARRFRS